MVLTGTTIGMVALLSAAAKISLDVGNFWLNQVSSDLDLVYWILIAIVLEVFMMLPLIGLIMKEVRKGRNESVM